MKILLGCTYRWIYVSFDVWYFFFF